MTPFLFNVFILWCEGWHVAWLLLHVSSIFWLENSVWKHPLAIICSLCSFDTCICYYVQAGDSLIQLYHNFIADFETKINLLKLAHFAVIVSRQYPEKEAAISFLEGVIEKLRATREMRIEEPILYIKMQIAIFNVEKGDQKECKKLLEDGKTTLDSMTDIDPSVYASYYWISSQYHKSRQEFAEFYKSALLYLAYTSVESISESFKLVWDYDVLYQGSWHLSFFPILLPSRISWHGNVVEGLISWYYDV